MEQYRRPNSSIFDRPATSEGESYARYLEQAMLPIQTGAGIASAVMSGIVGRR